jgi:hypothetical protein
MGAIQTVKMAFVSDFDIGGNAPVLLGAIGVVIRVEMLQELLYIANLQADDTIGGNMKITSSYSCKPGNTSRYLVLKSQPGGDVYHSTPTFVTRSSTYVCGTPFLRSSSVTSTLATVTQFRSEL